MEMRALAFSLLLLSMAYAERGPTGPDSALQRTPRPDSIPAAADDLAPPRAAPAAVEAAPLATAAPAAPPDFFRAETPGQIAGQALSGLAGALLGGWMGAEAGASEAQARCEDKSAPNGGTFSGFGCGFDELAGILAGMAIGLPLGHVLGVGIAGAMEGKRGVGYAMLASVFGDLVLGTAAIALSNASDDGPTPVLVGAAAAGMLAVPIMVQTDYDYRARYLVPHAGLAPGGRLRLGLALAEIRF